MTFIVFRYFTIDIQYSDCYSWAMKTTHDSQDSNRRMKRIKGFSKAARAVLLAVLLVEGASLLLSPVIVVSSAAMWKEPELHAAFENLGTLIVLPFCFLVTLNFFRLFTRLTGGHLFDSENIIYLKRAGKWWIVAGIIRGILGVAGIWIVLPTNINIPGDGIIAGLIVFFIAWLFGEAQKLQEEHEFTV